jgi:hypothetical protein
MSVCKRCLIKSGKFRVGGKKELAKESKEEKTMIVDATESAIERPKKNKKNGIVARKNDIR